MFVIRRVVGVEYWWYSRVVGMDNRDLDPDRWDKPLLVLSFSLPLVPIYTSPHDGSEGPDVSNEPDPTLILRLPLPQLQT